MALYHFIFSMCLCKTEVLNSIFNCTTPLWLIHICAENKVLRVAKNL